MASALNQIFRQIYTAPSLASKFSRKPHLTGIRMLGKINPLFSGFGKTLSQSD